MSKAKKRYFLPFELDAFGNCGPIGMACGLPVEKVSHGMLLLWLHVWRTKNDMVTTGHLVGFFFGTNPCEALLTFGHLEASEAGWRVKGAKEWLRVMGAQSEAGKAKSGNLKRGNKSPGSLPAPTPKTAEAGDKPAGSLPALPATSHQPPALKELLQAQPEKPARPPPTEPPDKFASGASFFAWVQFKRHEVGCVPEPPPHPQKLANWWSAALMELNGDATRLEAALYRFADDPFWEKSAPPMPFNAFAKEWPKYVPQKTAA